MKNYGNTILTGEKQPKYKQFMNSILQKMNSGDLKNGEKLPSIITCSAEYGLSRDTVLRAYRELYAKGAVTSVYRKGYFVSITKENQKQKKLLIISGKYNSGNSLFYKNLIDLVVKMGIYCGNTMHDNSMAYLERIIDEEVCNYHTFLIEPQMLSPQKIMKLFEKKGATNDVVILSDKEGDDLPTMSGKCISMPFKSGFLRMLHNKLAPLLDRYEKLNLLLPSKEYFPYRLINAFFDYCDDKNIRGEIIEEINEIVPHNAYFAVDETSLFDVLNCTNKSNMELGNQIGLLALFERDYFKYMNKKLSSISFYNKELIDCISSQVLNMNESKQCFSAKLHLRESL